MRLLAGFIHLAAAAAIFSAASMPALAQEAVSGRAHVIDGDTLHLTTPDAGKVVKTRPQGAPAAAAEPLDSLTVALYDSTPQVTPQATPQVGGILEHGGGLNGCGCHFNRKTGECHCHRSRGCGCACEAPSCGVK